MGMLEECYGDWKWLIKNKFYKFLKISMKDLKMLYDLYDILIEI